VAPTRGRTDDRGGGAPAKDLALGDRRQAVSPAHYFQAFDPRGLVTSRLPSNGVAGAAAANHGGAAQRFMPTASTATRVTLSRCNSGPLAYPSSRRSGQALA
jgi:hypothetical protein